MNDVLEVIERCATPRGELQLQRRGKHYEIISNGTFLMATYNGESERVLVKKCLEICDAPKSLLIGGLGVGFSLKEALDDLRVEQVCVVEIEEKIIDWNRTHLSEFSAHGLSDRRTKVVREDLLVCLGLMESQFDVMCFDIDNGPEWTVVDSNAQLYSDEGLRLLKRALKPKGVASFWSAAHSSSFVERLSGVFDHVEQYAVDHESEIPDYVYLVWSEK